MARSLNEEGDFRMSRPRIRYIKPEIWLSRDFQALSPCGRLTFLALISNADDEGRLKTDPAHLAVTYLPGCPTDEIASQLEVMESRRMAITYSVRHVRYVALVGWSTHQRVSHATRSDFPPPPKFKRAVGANNRQLDLDSLRRPHDDSGSRARLRTSSSSPATISSTTTITVASEAQQLCAALAASLAEWGAKGEVSSRWEVEAERMLRLDGRSLSQALEVLTWATHEDFWRPIILSIPKFRKKFDTLRGQMLRTGAPSVVRKSALDVSIERDLQEAAHLRREGL